MRVIPAISEKYLSKSDCKTFTIDSIAVLASSDAHKERVDMFLRCAKMLSDYMEVMTFSVERRQIGEKIMKVLTFNDSDIGEFAKGNVLYVVTAIFGQHLREQGVDCVSAERALLEFLEKPNFKQRLYVSLQTHSEYEYTASVFASVNDLIELVNECNAAGATHTSA